MNATLLKENDYLRSIIDAIPSMVFIVDSDLKIHDANRAAITLLGYGSEIILKRLCGEVLHCLYEYESGKQCGETEFCKDCVLRNSIHALSEGKLVNREKTVMKMQIMDKTKEIDLLVTASQIELDYANLYIMILEDVSELMYLRRLATICSCCNKVRNKEGEWEKVANYLAREENIYFSHGICPECMPEVYPSTAK